MSVGAGGLGRTSASELVLRCRLVCSGNVGDLTSFSTAGRAEGAHSSRAGGDEATVTTSFSVAS